MRCGQANTWPPLEAIEHSQGRALPLEGQDPRREKGDAERMFQVFTLLVGYFFMATLAASAQEVVHSAMIGTVSSIDPAAKDDYGQDR